MTNQELKELIEWQEAGGDVEYRKIIKKSPIEQEWGEWNIVMSQLSNFILVGGSDIELRKKEKPKLTHEQIMNEWLWSKENKYYFKIIGYIFDNLHKYIFVTKSQKIISADLGALQNRYELYTNQDKE